MDITLVPNSSDFGVRVFYFTFDAPGWHKDHAFVRVTMVGEFVPVANNLHTYFLVFCEGFSIHEEGSTYVVVRESLQNFWREFTGRSVVKSERDYWFVGFDPRDQCAEQLEAFDAADLPETPKNCNQKEKWKYDFSKHA